MKKDEMVDLHELMALAAEYYVENSYDVDVESGDELGVSDEVSDVLDLEDYRDRWVEPLHVHKSKGDHKRSVFDLANAITEDSDIEYEGVRVEERRPHYFERRPEAISILRELHQNGSAESLIGLSDRMDLAYSSIVSRVNEMVEKGWLEDEEEGLSRGVYLPGYDFEP